jgi:hypothetical protein
VSKKKGDFRAKIDSILAEGDVAPPGNEKEPLRSRIDSILAGETAGGGQATAERPDVLARMLAPTTETKLDEIAIVEIKVRKGRATAADKAAIAELKASIADRGIVQPVLLRPTDGGGFELIDGQRRLAAARDLGLTALPAVVRSLSNADVAAPAAARAEARKAVPTPSVSPAPWEVDSAAVAAAAATVAGVAPAPRAAAGARSAPKAKAGSRAKPVPRAKAAPRGRAAARAGATPEVEPEVVVEAPATPAFGGRPADPEATIVKFPDPEETMVRKPSEPLVRRPAAPAPTFGGTREAERPRVAAASYSSLSPAAAPPDTDRAQFVIRNLVIAIFAFAATNYLFLNDGATGTGALVLGVIGAIVALFLYVWKRS